MEGTIRGRGSGIGEKRYFGADVCWWDRAGGRVVAYEIRQFGDPVLKTRASPVTEFDEPLKRLVGGMLET